MALDSIMKLNIVAKFGFIIEIQIVFILINYTIDYQL
jgi:hypothetical protein